MTSVAPPPDSSPGPLSALPQPFVFGVVVLSFLPSVMALLGIDLGSALSDDHVPPVGLDFTAFRGVLVHTLLEWSASAVAAFTVVLAFAHYAVRRDPLVPVLGLALLSAGCMDAFHTFAADRLIAGNAPTERLIPFTWALSRSFHVVILMVGMAALWFTKRSVQRSPGFLVVVSLTLVLLSYLLMLASATAPQLPQTTFPDAIITRPYDVFPLVMLGVAAVTLYLPFARRHPSLFVQSLLLSVLPELMCELHMAFGSTALFDHHFVAGHALKLLGYSVPLTGLVLDYVAVQRADLAQRARTEQLAEEKRSLYAKHAEELERHAQETEEASRYKSQFIANLSHELRTPLNSMLILSEVLARNDDGNLTEEQAQSAHIIHSGGLDLLGLVNDILDLSKVEAGMMDMLPEDVRADQVVDHLRMSFASQAREKGVALRTHVDPDVDVLHSDPMRLEQVLRNLISNALKFTDDGVVTLKVRPPHTDEQKHIADHRLTSTSPPADDDGDWVCFAVHDTGVGIGADKLASIFDAFRQADGTISRSHGGTGLGLTISRKMADLLGGFIRVQSEVDVGSTFTLLLPRSGPARRDDDDGPSTTTATSPPSTWARSPAATSPTAASPTATSSTATSPTAEDSTWTASRPQLSPAAPSIPVSMVAPVVEDVVREAPVAPAQPKAAANDDHDMADPAGLTPSTTLEAPNVLVLAQDPTFAVLLQRLVRRHGFTPVAVHSAEGAIGVSRESDVVAAVVDADTDDAWRVLFQMRYSESTRDVPVFMITGTERLWQARREADDNAPGSVDIEGPRLEHRVVRSDHRHFLQVGNAARLASLLPPLEGLTTDAAPDAEAVDAMLREALYDGLTVDLDDTTIDAVDVLRRARRSDLGEALTAVVRIGPGTSAAALTQLVEMGVVFVDESNTNYLFEHLSVFLHLRRAQLHGLAADMHNVLAGSVAALADKRVLLVDDDIRNTFALSMELKRAGMQVALADNGQAALTTLESDPNFDVVLMDVMMPVMDGLTAMRALRQHPTLHDLPVLALTAKVLAADHVECLDAGASDYISKPVDVAKLLRVLATWCVDAAWASPAADEEPSAEQTPAMEVAS